MKKLFFISILSVLLFSISCTNERIANIEDTETNLKLQKDVEFIFEASAIIQNELQNSRNSVPTEFTQEQLDYYLDLVGLEEGYMSLEFFNEVLEAISIAQQNGIEPLLDQYGFTGFKKESMMRLSTGEYIENLTEHPEFQNLPISDRETLELTNLLMDNLDSNTRSPECFIAITGGTGVGCAICGPPCCVGGGVVGLVVCIWTKEGGGQGQQ